jgi:2-methylcitrate dehydratase PrpD
MEHIQFKVYPAQFRTQTALEAAIPLHSAVAPRLDDVSLIEIHTHQRTLRTVDKPGPLTSPSARDHSLQYITAIGLIHGALDYGHYHDATAADPRIEALIGKMRVAERPDYTAGYQDRARGMDANAIRIQFNDGSATDEIEILYPMGDPKRRDEALPVLAEKFRHNLRERLPASQEEALLTLYSDPKALSAMTADAFMALTVSARETAGREQEHGR